MAKRNTTNKKQKVLERLASELLKQDDYFGELKKIGKAKSGEGMLSALNDLFDGIKHSADPKAKTIIEKAKMLLRQVRSNIAAVGASKNFDIQDMQNDATTLQDVIFRIESINSFTKEQLQTMNRLHKKHIKIKQVIDK